jgi:hypothetical protein
VAALLPQATSRTRSPGAAVRQARQHAGPRAEHGRHQLALINLSRVARDLPWFAFRHSSAPRSYVVGIERSRRPAAAGRIKSAARQLLDASTLCAIATVAPRCHAHINSAYFAWTPETRQLLVLSLSDPFCTLSVPWKPLVYREKRHPGHSLFGDSQTRFRSPPPQ